MNCWCMLTVPLGHQLKRLKAVTTCAASIVVMTSVGFAWRIGSVTTLPPEDTSSLSCVYFTTHWRVVSTVPVLYLTTHVFIPM